jgi:peptidyl-dipeptidase Dcp
VHFLPAYEEGIRLQNLEYESIVNNQAKPNFENTVTAIEKSGQLLTKVNKVFSSSIIDINDEMRIARKYINAIKTYDDFYLNEKLFKN